MLVEFAINREEQDLRNPQFLMGSPAPVGQLVGHLVDTTLRSTRKLVFATAIFQPE